MKKLLLTASLLLGVFFMSFGQRVIKSAYGNGFYKIYLNERLGTGYMIIERVYNYSKTPAKLMKNYKCPLIGKTADGNPVFRGFYGTFSEDMNTGVWNSYPGHTPEDPFPLVLSKSDIVVLNKVLEGKKVVVPDR